LYTYIQRLPPSAPLHIVTGCHRTGENQDSACAELLIDKNCFRLSYWQHSHLTLS